MGGAPCRPRSECITADSGLSQLDPSAPIPSTRSPSAQFAVNRNSPPHRSMHLRFLAGCTSGRMTFVPEAHATARPLNTKSKPAQGYDVEVELTRPNGPSHIWTTPRAPVLAIQNAAPEALQLVGRMTPEKVVSRAPICETRARAERPARSLNACAGANRGQEPFGPRRRSTVSFRSRLHSHQVFQARSKLPSEDFVQKSY